MQEVSLNEQWFLLRYKERIIELDDDHFAMLNKLTTLYNDLTAKEDTTIHYLLEDIHNLTPTMR
jgi:hypothetical protein